MLRPGLVFVYQPALATAWAFFVVMVAGNRV
jgi:hypothetical protein